MRGFTNPRGLGGYLLLEVVLALLLASLLLGGVMAIATGSLQVSEVIAEDGRRQLTREAFLTFLGRNFQQLPGNAELQLIRSDGGSHYTSDLTFQNVPTSFSWSGQAVSAEAVQLSAVLRRSGDLDIILRYYEEALLDDSDSTADVQAEPVAEITLLRNVWRFEWWALDGRTMEWTEDWDVRGRLPLQMELNVIFDRNGEEIIHYFWIPPKVNPETVMRSQLRAAPVPRGEGNQPGGDGDRPRGGGDRPDRQGDRPGGGGPQVRPVPGGTRGGGSGGTRPGVGSGGGATRPPPPVPGR